jgi:transposase-like protein
MKKSKQRTPEQIVDILRTIERETATGKTIGQSVRELGISEWTYYRWRKQYAGMNKQDAKKLKDLEKENARLKKLLAEKDLDIDMLKEVIEGKY